MPLSIVDLPEEILDPIIGALLPEYSSNGLFLDTRAYEHPVDLLCCRLVCRRLFRPASRWLYRRVHMKLSSFKRQGHITGTPFSHPEYAANTRVLQIASSTRFGSYKLQPCSPAIAPLFSQMRNLRILIVQLSPILLTQVLPQLLPLPMLHTVVLEGSEGTVDFVDWSRIEGPFPNIKRLDFRRTTNIGPLISLSPFLEELSVRPSARLDGVLSSITIPWGTLRRLTFENVMEFEKTCVAIMESYQNLIDNDTFCASLTELIVTQNMTIADAHRLLTTFSGQPLRSLLLGSVVNLDIQFVERVIVTFPKLREFALLKISADSHVSATELNHYAAVLGRLQELQVLHLNWIRHDNDDRVWLHSQLDRILVPIVAHCLKLTHVRFMHQGDGVSTTIIITRDHREQYINHVYKTSNDRCSLATLERSGNQLL